MQSDDETPTQNDTSKDKRERSLLRREASVTDRQRISLVAGALSLAGVALGFGLGQVSSANSNCAHSVIVQTGAPTATRQIVHPNRMAPLEARLTWLGVAVESGHNLPAGAFVKSVFPGSPAAAAGLRPGHRIVQFENASIHSAGGLIRQVRLHEAGEKILLYAQDERGRGQELSVVLDSISPSEFRQLDVR